MFYSLSHSYRWMNENDFDTFYANFLAMFTKNENFPDLQAFLPDLAQRYAAWKAAILPVETASRSSRKLMEKNWGLLIQLLDKLNYGVQFTSNNDTEVLASSGFQVIGGKREAVTTAPKKTYVEDIQFPKINGQMKVKVKARRNTLMYYARLDDVQGNLVRQVSNRNTELTFNGLPTSVPLQLIVWASGSGGDSEPSRPEIVTVNPISMNLLPPEDAAE